MAWLDADETDQLYPWRIDLAKWPTGESIATRAINAIAWAARESKQNGPAIGGSVEDLHRFLIENDPKHSGIRNLGPAGWEALTLITGEIIAAGNYRPALTPQQLRSAIAATVKRPESDTKPTPETKNLNARILYLEQTIGQLREDLQKTTARLAVLVRDHHATAKGQKLYNDRISEAIVDLRDRTHALETGEQGQTMESTMRRTERTEAAIKFLQMRVGLLEREHAPPPTWSIDAMEARL